jgi:hypothetical protein
MEQIISMDEIKKGTSSPRFLAAAVVFTFVAYIIHMLGAFATMSYYLDSTYFTVWSKIMMPTAGPPSTEFTFYSLLFGFIAAVLFVAVYGRVKPLFSGKPLAKAGMLYGIGVFLVGTLPGSLMLLLLINVPAALVISWALESLVAYLIGGAIVAKITK